MTSKNQQADSTETTMAESELAPDNGEFVRPGAPLQSETPEHPLLGEKLTILTQAFENAPDGIQITDMSGYIVYANKAIERIYGFTPEEQRGKHVGEMNAEPGFADQHTIPSLRSTGRWEGEILVKHKDGRIFPIWLATSVVKNDRGEPIALTGISRDITEQKKVEEEKEKLLHDVGERVKELNCLYAIAKVAADPEVSFGELCQKTVDIMLPAWQHPEIACARTLIHDQEYKTANFKKTKWLQAVDVTEHGNKVGTVEVYYLEERPVLHEGPFLKEERDLIEGIAERLGNSAERKRDTEFIEDQIARQTALLSASQAYVYFKDRDLKYVAMNNSMADMLGTDLASVRGKTDFDFFPKSDANSFRALDRQVMESGVSATDVEESYETPEDETRWALTSKVPYRGPDGDVIGMVGTSMDITALKRTEIALVSSEKKYRKLLELANDAIFVAEVETGIIVEANQKASELLGRPVEEIIGINHTEVHPPGAADQHHKKFKQHANEDRGETTELLVRHANGHDVPVEVSSSVVELDGKRFMKGIFRDLTGRNRAKELRDALNDLSIIITSTLDFDEIVQKVVVAAAEALGAESCAVLTRETDGWILRYTDGGAPGTIGTRFTDDQAKASVVATSSGKPVAIEDAYNSDLVDPELMRQYQVRSMLIVPLIAQDEVFGTMGFQYHSTPDIFTSAEIDWAAKLATLLSLAFKNTRLYAHERQIAQELQEAQHLAHFGSWEWDIASRSTKCSDELYRIYGVEPATFDASIFENFLDCIHPQDREHTVKVIEELRDGEEPFEIKYRIIRPHGEVRWVHARGEAICDEFNKPVTIRGTTQDITKSKKDALVLAERETKYQSLFENMIDGFAFHKIVVDDEGKPVDYVFLEINEAFEKLTGIKAKEVMGKKVTEALPGIEKDPADWIGVYGKVALGGAAIRFEQYSEAVGKWFSVAAFSPMKDHFMVIFEDVTERKQIEAALARSEHKYRKLLELANDAVFVVDVETGLIVETNRKASELLGRPVEEIIGIHHIEIHPPDKLDQYRAEFRQHVGKGGEVVKEVLVRHASGRDVPVEISSSVIELDGKRYMKGIFRDVTKRNRAKELGDNLNEVNSIINSTLKINEVVDKVVSTSAVAIGADSAAFFLLDDDHWVLEQVHGPSPHEPGTKLPYDMLNPPPRMVKNPAPVAISDACNDDRANKELARKVGLRSLLLIPLVSDERVLGMLVFRYFTKQMEFAPEEIDFSTKLGASIALALENARLFSEQQTIAKTLQESLLVIPEELPHVEFGHLYRSASEAALVGGDFYDLFTLQGDRVGVVVGDVSGKGLEAAALTSMLKHTVKGYAYEGHSPGAIISKTNALVMKETDSCTFVTTFVGILDTQSGVLTYCCAGHPPPIIKRQNGDIDVLDTTCTAVGVLDYLDPLDSQQRLKEGDLITLYTDGVIEARCKSGMFSEDRLIDLIRRTNTLSAAETPQVILDELTSHCECVLSDDIAILSLSLQQ